MILIAFVQDLYKNLFLPALICNSLSILHVNHFEFLENVGNSYRVELLETIKVHLIFSPDKLRKSSDDPLPGQKNDPPLPMQVNGDDEWEADEILASKLVRRSLQYRVSYDPNPTWYPAWNFVCYPQKFKEFHDNYPEKPGPPKYLDKWIECWHNNDDKQPVEHHHRNAPKA
jgi:hypothetical protein